MVSARLFESFGLDKKPTINRVLSRFSAIGADNEFGLSLARFEIFNKVNYYY